MEDLYQWFNPQTWCVTLCITHSVCLNGLTHYTSTWISMNNSLEQIMQIKGKRSSYTKCLWTTETSICLSRLISVSIYNFHCITIVMICNKQISNVNSNTNDAFVIGRKGKALMITYKTGHWWYAQHSKKEKKNHTHGFERERETFHHNEVEWMPVHRKASSTYYVNKVWLWFCNKMHSVGGVPQAMQISLVQHTTNSANSRWWFYR